MNVTIDGIERGFFFGTHTFRIIREVSGVDSIEDVFKKLVNEKKEYSLVEQITFISTFLYSCARHYNESNSIAVDFNEANVSDWMDELGLTESMKLVTELVKVYKTKNLKAPAMGHLKQA